MTNNFNDLETMRLISLNSLLIDRRYSVYCYSRYGTVYSYYEEKAVHKIFYNKLQGLVKKGYEYFITDLANEFQLKIAKVFCQLKKRFPQVKIVIMIPYYYGYWTGKQWTLDLLKQVNLFIKEADFLCCIQPEKYSLGKHNTDFFVRKLFKVCSMVLGYKLGNEKIEFYKQLDWKNAPVIESLYKEIVEEMLREKKEAFSFCPKMDTDSVSHCLSKLNPMQTVCLCLNNEKCRDDKYRCGMFTQLIKAQLKEVISLGYKNFVIPVENTLQVLAGEVVLELFKTVPDICCFVIISKNQDKLMQAGSNWVHRVKRFYERATLRAVYYQKDEIYQHIFGAVSGIIYSFLEKRVSVAIQLKDYPHLKHFNIESEIREAIEREHRVLQEKAYFEYVYKLTHSFEEVALRKSGLEAVGKESKTHFLREHYLRYPNINPFVRKEIGR